MTDLFRVCYNESAESTEYVRRTQNDIHDSEGPEMKKTRFAILLFVLLLCILLCGTAAAESGEGPASAELQAGSERILFDQYRLVLQDNGWRDKNGPILNWTVTEYLGEWFPRTDPYVTFPQELDGFDVDAPSHYRDYLTGVYASLVRENGIYLYAPVSETECYLVGYTGYEEAVTLPSELDGLTVTGIADYAFSYSGFTLESFSDAVVFPDTIRYVGKSAFALADARFTLGDGVEYIGNHAFLSMKQTDFYLPGSLKELGINPFGGDYYVGRDAQPLYFTDKSGAYVEFVNDTFSEINGALYSTGDMKLIAWLDHGEMPGSPFPGEEYTVAEGTRCIGSEAFFACADLKKVVLPDGLETIEASAFAECTQLESVNIPESVTSIGDYAFSDTAITSIRIPAGVTEIGEEAFCAWSADSAQVTIVCKKGSVAESYALENGYTIQYFE